jgi:hypothetical protein
LGNTRHRSLVCLFVLVFGLASVATAAAQSALTGIVHDPSGQLAVGATITVFDLPSLMPHPATKTSAIGYYEIDLPPGEYRIQAILDKLSFTGTAHVSANEKTAFDIALQFRSQDRVVVQGAIVSGPDASFSNAGLGVSIAGETIDTSPLMRGRTVQSVLPLVPGVFVTETTGSQAQITAMGERRFSNRLSIDDMSVDLAVNVGGPGIGNAGSQALPGYASSGGTQTLVPAAAIDEIQIHRLNAPPELAQTPGAQMTIRTRSGGARFKGATFLDVRPSSLGAREWFASFSGEPGQRSSLAAGGTSLGGPLWRGLSFFTALERQHVDRPIAASITVPSIAARDTAPVALQPVLNAFPAPNRPAHADDPNLADLVQRAHVQSNLSTVSLRLDGSLGPGHDAFARGNVGTSRGDTLDTGLRIPALSFSHLEATSTRTLTAGLSSVLSATLVNDLRVNVSHHRGTLDAAAPLPLADLAPAGGDAWVRVNLLPGPGGTLIAGHTGGATQRQVQLRDVLTYLRGAHEWRGGIDVTDTRAASAAARHRYTYAFTGLDQLLAGRVRQVTLEDAEPAAVRFYAVALFAQDTMHLGMHTTVTYGLRYGIAPAPASDTSLAPALIRLESQPAMQELPKGATLWRTSWANLAPSIAASHQAGGTTFRAGWSLTDDELTPPGATAFGRGYPYLQRTVVRPATFPAPAASLEVPAGAALAAEYYAFPRDFRTPRSYAWHAGTDRALGATDRLSVAYLGTAGRDLVYWYALPGPNPALSQTVQVFTNAARSDYHALAAQYTHRLSHGLQAATAYTWSHAIDTDSGESLTPQPPPAIVDPALNRGSADFDRRHALNVKGSWQLPTPSWPAVHIIGAGWQLDAVATLRSGAPVTVTALRNLGGLAYTARPDLALGVPQWIPDPSSPTGERINSAAFVIPDAPRQGTLGRNTLNSSPLREVDLALSRTLRFNQRIAASLRLEGFNVFNIANFGPPLAQLGFTNFGAPNLSAADALGTGTLQAGGLVPLQQPGAARSLRVGVHLQW